MISPQNVTTDLHNHPGRQRGDGQRGCINPAMARSKAARSIWSGRNLEWPTPRNSGDETQRHHPLERTKGKSPNSLNAGPAPMNSPNPTKSNLRQPHTCCDRDFAPPTSEPSIHPAFDAVRLGTAGAVRQQFARGGGSALAISTRTTPLRTLGEQNAASDRLSQRRIFDHSIGIHVTASSNAINKDADRQNAVTLANLLAPTTKKCQLVTTVSNPMVPPKSAPPPSKSRRPPANSSTASSVPSSNSKDPGNFVVTPATKSNKLQESPTPKTHDAARGRVRNAWWR